MKEPTVKRIIIFNQEDYEKLKARYPTVGVSAVVRTLVRQHIRACETREEELKAFHLSKETE